MSKDGLSDVIWDYQLNGDLTYLEIAEVCEKAAQAMREVHAERIADPDDPYGEEWGDDE
jgi:hypothetical protein